MTKIDIFSGFLGAGKTTLIKKLIAEAYQGEQLVLIENEFGEIGIDGGFLKDSGVQINEMNSGCICCSLVGDFATALHQVIEQYHPDRILIEPSGVGKLSDVIRAVQSADTAGAVLNGFTTVADAGKVKMYMKNFGEFYNNQIEHASTIILSRTQGVKEDKLETAVALLREHNAQASIITTPWDQLTGKQILAAMEQKSTLQAELEALAAEAEHEQHHHHDHEDGECCCHDHDHDHEHEHHHHDHKDGECCCHDHDHDQEHEHHHHDHEDGECCCHDHDHDHEHEHHHHDHEDGECSCGHHHDHHHHHADEVFTSFGRETTRKFTDDEILHALEALDDGDKYGVVLRAKGIVQGEDGQWIHFDYVPGAPDVRHGSAEIIGRLCVIGSKLNENAVAALFGLN
ncbi:MAG TPA: GTP-binding protein [Candidatus Faecivivens stercorigallinarum]|nr:GTP-binding protein [Candidatus Faecivivens stercorigallinarum]